MTYAMLWDANYIQDMERFDTHGCSRMFPHANGAESVWLLEFNEAVFMRISTANKESLFPLDTIEELADKLGLPREALEGNR